MKIFGFVYKRVMAWSRHPHAPWYLCALSFLESFILPISPLVIQLPLSLARPHRAVRYAVIATVGSIVGGLVGYFIGVCFIGVLLPHLYHTHYYDEYLRLQGWVTQWGLWVLFPVALSPIPYKLTTLTAGALSIAFWPFFVVTGVARVLHFMSLALVVKYGGKRMRAFLIGRCSNAARHGERSEGA